jgi:hypothetical protein
MRSVNQKINYILRTRTLPAQFEHAVLNQLAQQTSCVIEQRKTPFYIDYKRVLSKKKIQTSKRKSVHTLNIESDLNPPKYMNPYQCTRDTFDTNPNPTSYLNLDLSLNLTLYRNP